MLFLFPALAAVALALVEDRELLHAAAADFFVPSLPGFEGKLPTMHAGRLLANPQSQGKLFFWSVDSRYKGDMPQRTILWLNGGPGCSSMDGMFLELGPFQFTARQGDTEPRLTAREGSWHDYANMIFLDQPLGVGYSAAKSENYVSELDVAGENVVEFLEQYFKVFPEHLNDELYIAGESYAGQYIPYVYQAYVKRKRERAEANQAIKVPEIKGLMLLSPWIDSSHQYLSQFNFLEKAGLLKTKGDADNEEKLHHECLTALSDQTLLLPDNKACNQILQYALSHYDNRKTCFNIYDYRIQDSYPSCGMNWPEGVTEMRDYLSRNDVRAALNVPAESTEGASKWDECALSVQTHFKAQMNPTSSTKLPEILAQVPIIIMSGNYDVICNTDGLQSMINTMIWGGSTTRGFDDGQGEVMNSLKFEGLDVGTYQSGRNLTFVTFINGTHMLPVGLNLEVRAAMHGFTGIAQDYNLTAAPTASQNSTSASGSSSASAKDQANSQAINEAMKRAYKQAGVTALVVVIILVIAFFVWLQWRGEGGLSCTNLLKAVLHVGRPRISSEYINLRSFKRTGVPATIQEESEPEDV